MKLLTTSFVISVLPLFSQDQTIQQRASEQIFQGTLIARAIAANEAFELPDKVLGSVAKVTATKWISDDGYTLRLAGVEIQTDKLLVQSDQLIFRWATGEIEPSGNVRVKPVPVAKPVPVNTSTRPAAGYSSPARRLVPAGTVNSAK